MNKRPINILLAEDDLNLGILLGDFLKTEGLTVKLCRDGELGLKAFRDQRFDLCLLDVMLPKLDGFTVAKAIRNLDNKMPIIFITAKSLKEDKLIGYDVGADDYITKPFDEEELLCKIKALLRRTTAREEEHKPTIIQVGKYEFDSKNQSLCLNGKLKRITEKECEILNYLYVKRNTLIKREDLLKAVWGENDYFLGRSLDVFITKIRKYLKDDARINIENVFGVGFIFKTPS